MTRAYPDEVAGPYDPPPRTFADAEGRELRVHGYGEGPAEDEAEALVEMYVAFDPEDRAQGIPPTGEERVREWLGNILADECVNVVAWHDEDAVGHATLVPDGEDAYELAIFVLSAYQNAGVGTRLIESLLGAGREEGIDRVWLTVERWNTPAVNLYRKVGFESAGSGSFEMEMAALLSE
jgi:ribosomal protein S18 acetylase RimI-like enzyme